jgi:hypothetical protein
MGQMPAHGANSDQNAIGRQFRGYGPVDAERLAFDLVKAGAGARMGRWDAREVWRALIGGEICMVSGRPNMVLGVSGDIESVRTERRAVVR